MNAFSRDYKPQIQHKPKPVKRPTTEFHRASNWCIGSATEADKAKTARIRKPSGV